MSSGKIVTRELDDLNAVRAALKSSTAVASTRGLLPLIAFSAAISGPAFAQSVDVDEITVGGGGTPTPVAAPEETYAEEPEPAAPAPTDLSLRDGGAGVLNPGQSSSARATAPLLNTPQTISIIPGTIIQQRNATSVVEALRNTPGITFDAGENGFSAGPNQFNIRGFNSVGSLFVDDTRDNGSFTRDTFNIEGIEVVKGAAADQGRGTAGGYINQVTKTPQLGNFIAGDVGIGFDEYDSEMRRRATLDVNQSFGTTAVRLNTMIQDGGLAGRDVAEANAWGVAPSLTFGLGTDFRAIFAYEHYERNDLPDAGVAVNRTLTQRGVGIKGAGPRPYTPGHPRDTFFGRTTDYDDTESDAFLARFEYDLAPGITVSNQTRYANVQREAVLSQHPSNPDNAMGVFPYNRDSESLFNQTNLTAKFSTGAFKHTVSTGIDLSREKAYSDRLSDQSSDLQIDTAAVYLFDTIELSRQWQLTGGIRVENYDLSLVGDVIPTVPPTTRYSDSETTVGGKIGIAYKPVDEGTIYASWGLSHLPHGSLLSNPDPTRNNANGFPGFVPGADPVELQNYEVGVKWDWFGGALSTTAALFHTEKSKVAYPAGGGDIVYGRQEVQGLELGIAGKITERWQIYGGLTWMDSERKHGIAVDDALRDGGSGNDYGGALTTNGDELAYTPNFFATLWMTYDLTDKFTFGGGVQYVGDSWIGRPDDALRVIKNGVYGKLPDYFLVNLYASYDITENIELALNVDNVFDETYLTTMNWNGNWGYLGAPRTYWLSANFKY